MSLTLEASDSSGSGVARGSHSASVATAARQLRRQRQGSCVGISSWPEALRTAGSQPSA